MKKPIMVILAMAVLAIVAAPSSAQIAFTGGSSGGGGGGSTPSGTGFVHVVGGVQDGASKAVDVSSADITGVLKASASPALTGSTTSVAGALATKVVAIDGASGSVPIASTGNVFTWAAATTAPGILQTAAASGAGADITITPQAPTTTGASGNLTCAVAAPASGTVEAGFGVTRGGTGIGRLQALVGTANTLALYGPGTPYTAATSTNYGLSIANNGGGTTINSSAGTTSVTSANNVVITAGAAQTITLSGAQLVRVRAVVNHAASPYAVTLGDYVIPVDAVGGVVTVTLPAPAAGRSIIVKDSTGHAAASNITIAQHAAETIDGAASVVMTKNFDTLWIVTDGTNWFVMGEFSSSIVP